MKIVLKIKFLTISGIIMLYSSGLFADLLQFPAFSKIEITKLEADVDQSILKYKTVVKQVSANKDINSYKWEQLIQPIEDAACELDKITNIIAHLHSVQDSPELRKVYSNILPKISDLTAEVLQDKVLQQKILQLKGSKDFSTLNLAQKKIIENFLLDFKLAGVDLPAAKQERYRQIMKQLSELSDRFSKNVLDATQNWSYHVSAKNKLRGLPKHFIELSKQTAEKRGFKDGWMLTLDLPCVDVVLRHAKDRAIRKIIYKAHVTKASDQFDKDKVQFDNSKIMQSIVELRTELAQLLGFKNYSEYSLAHKMAKSTKEVVNFLDELAKSSEPVAKKEFLKLQQFASKQDNLKKLQPWDVAYYSEMYKETLFSLSEEQLRNYFQLKNVLPGMFKLANTLYGITVQPVTEFDKWDPEVKLYKVMDQSNNLRGYFYIDLYVRENKQGGAWMGSCLSRHQLQDGTLQYPVAFLITNFTKPTANTTPLLYHNELTTLLHEFGHVLHHILTKVNYISVAGVNGVSWDAVELPSQFMEKWGYDWQFLQDVSAHHQTQEKISQEMFDSLVGIKNYQAGMFMARQLEFAIFDFNLHMTTKKPNIQKVLNQARAMVTVVPVAKFNRFQNSFSHIFAGGYAAGYYSYNWAEVLASDAFMAFHDAKGALRQSSGSELGASFLKNILEMGGSKDAMELYVAFRGKEPSIKSLLEYKGLSGK